MKYEIIIFDADDTLFDFKKSEKIAFRDTIINFGLDYDENYHFPIYKEINNGVWKELEDGRITQYELNLIRFRRLTERMKFDGLQSDLDSSAIADFYKKRLSQAAHLYDDSITLIEGLCKDYRLLILSNGLKEIQENRIRNSAIAKYFDNIVISEEVGVSKPDPRIFAIALNEIGCTNKEKILMVGDSLSSDIQGGINFGIDTCWFNPNKATNDTKVKPTYEISSLTEVRNVLLK
ncbi:YjjG family noncanonical pyrimidine nucleotidase [Sinanaerobacter chloroacetimidivorans]|uniref:YjjG family noncanonical pyrimidine nucleotidase n=1 Tax=Sinanaerobacter chloroacetimidivorans TaxID=2818044 RepID=A0A8J8B1Y3_9FIRM|nr:YjjG family noncanonical pyrimidine nucleotidase [Sinanaerobacter chloroacetimidivorans]MBR0598166.1 YjjG family noncanonical pyrimidine nucleotidase [Sinanaerobacter chloroacetimidivorans]